MKQSKLLTKTRKDISQQDPSINAQLLEKAGYVSKLMAGVYSYLPLGLRVLTNIENIVREEMNALGAQEVLLPGLQPRDIWDITGRWDKIDVLYKLKSSNKDLALGPTHEEVVTPLVKSFIQSYKDLPQEVYQIQTKFRDEARSKSGLLRGREFRMKDLYSFHTSTEDLDTYYEGVIKAYRAVFARCGLGDITYLTYASGGVFSKYSHEFQTITPNGEDIIFICEPCKLAINKEIIGEQSTCPGCKSKDLVEKKSIEVGNIFKLMARFSEPFDVKFTDATGKDNIAIMGCYGLGTSRLMGAIVEILHDDKGIMWPAEVAPFDIHLIALAKTDEEKAKADDLYAALEKQGFKVLFDDRYAMQPGAKFADSDLLGIPTRIVISNKTLAIDSVEVKCRTTGQIEMVKLDDIVKKIKKS